MPEEKFKFKPVDPQTTDERVIEFIQTRILASKIDQLRQSVPKTYVINPKDPMRIDGREDVLDIKGSGQMREFMVSSDVSDFAVHVKVDGDTLYSDSWDDLRKISQFVGEMAAFKEGGKYYIHLEDISFKKSLSIGLHGIFTAEHIFIKYDLYPPRGRRFMESGGAE